DVLVVIDDQDSALLPLHAVTGVSNIAAGSATQSKSWQVDDEGRTTTLRGFHPDPPTVRLDELPRDEQAEPQAAERARGTGAFESLEDEVLLVGRYARPAIGNDDLITLVATPGRDRHLGAGRILDHVAEQVLEHLLEPIDVPPAGKRGCQIE